MKAEFLSDLVLVPDDGGEMWTVRGDLIYKSTDREIVVPDGFRTDLASIPRFVWDIFPPTSIPRPSVLHDYLYTTQKFPRLWADDFLYEAMVATGVGYTKRWLIYHNVRWFGGASWHKQEKKNAASVTKLS